MATGWRICAMILLVIALMLPLLSAAPVDPRGDTQGQEDVPEQERRDLKFSFDMSDLVWNTGDIHIDVSGSLSVEDGSIGHKLDIDVNEHSHDQHKHRDDGHRAGTVPVDCQWSKYTDWSSCSASCGEGTRQRDRSITTPAKDGGKPCVGGEVEKKPCKQGTCTGEVCTVGEINSATCFCKSTTGDESGEVCSHNQVCTEKGTCYDVCTLGPYKLQEDCFCQEKTTRRWKLCTEGSQCGDGGCLFKEAQESCGFDDNLLIPRTMIDGKMSPHDKSALFKWENNLIPYYYNTTDESLIRVEDKDLVRSVMDRIEEKTCFKFEEKKKEEYEDKRVLEIFINNTSCSAGCSGVVRNVPYKPKRTQLYLSAHITDNNGDDCGYKGVLIHELMHALGVGHTQTRSDRDNFITVRFENIDKNMESQFQKCETCTLYDEIPYDCGSIMHYGTHMYGKEVIVPKENCELGHFPLSLSVPDAPEKDYELLNIIGKCPVCVTSPEYPYNYPDNSDTKHNLSVPDGHRIEITFHHFDVENHITCSYDYLQFLDENSNIIGEKMCGQSSSTKMIIPESIAFAHFNSDYSINKKGYKFCYRPLKPVCSVGEINSASCFCKPMTGDESGEECSHNQGCTEEGTCYDVCTPGPDKLQEDCFCQEKTTQRGKLCTEGSRCEDGGCLVADNIQKKENENNF